MLRAAVHLGRIPWFQGPAAYSHAPPLAAAAAAAAAASTTTTAAAGAATHCQQEPHTSSSHHQHHHNSSSSSSSSWLTTAGAAAAAAAAATAASVAAADSNLPAGKSAAAAAVAEAAEADGVKAGGKLLSLSLRQRIFFKYEKRIRDLSSLEKIYDYFATHEKEGSKVMSSQDVVRALVPTYPPVGSDVERAGYLDGERGHSQDTHAAHNQLLHFFDHDRDGTISFNEFVLIVIILSVPEKDVDIVFDVMDLDNNGVIDVNEFSQVLQQLERRAGLNQAFHGRVGKHSASNMGDNKQLTHKLFQTTDGGVSLTRFRDFLARLQEGMLKLEFAHYDTKQCGFITGADFGNSLVTAADIKVVDKYLDKVRELPPELASAKISYADFKAMVQLRRSMHMLSFALDFCNQVERQLTRADFAKLIQRTMGVQLSQAVLDILFQVFAGPDDTLDGPSFVDTMKRRNRVPGYKKGRGLAATEEEGSLQGLLSCIGGCIFGSSSDGLRLPQQ